MNPPVALVNWSDGSFQVEGARASAKKLGQLQGVFADHSAWQELDPEAIVYRVWWWEPVTPGTEGGLFWGTTEIQPGRVGDEYYMTHGHRHSISNRAEFYGCVAGTGVLVLRDQEGRAWTEEMKPGSLHYVAGDVAHRMVNTGTIPLRSIACWPSDAGHDYNISGASGFGIRIVEENGRPVIRTST